MSKLTLRWFKNVTGLVVCFALCAQGCARTDARPGSTAGAGEYETLSLRYESQAAVVSPPELAEDLGYLAPIKLDYVGITSGGPQSLQAVLTGDVDFGASFNGSIVRVVAAKAPIKAVVGAYGADKDTWHGYYVLEDSPIRTARDLIGKRVAMNTLGAHAEFLLREYLMRSGLTREESKQVTLVPVPPVNCEQTLRQRQVEVAALASIYKEHAVQHGGLRLLFSDVDLLGEFTAGSYFMSERFLRENPNTARKFVTAVGKVLEWQRNTPREQVIARMEKIIARRRRNEDASVVKFWRSVSVPSRAGLLTDKDFQIWIDWLVRDGQLKAGTVKPGELYTNEFGDTVALAPPR